MKPPKQPPRIAVLDANILFSAAMRDFFMHLAAGHVFQPKWTDEIHEEWIEAVLRHRSDLTRAALERTHDLMNLFGHAWQVPDSYHSLIPAFTLSDLDDRHVLAAAIAAKAPTIVTLNIRDFPETVLWAYGIRAITPDLFACELLSAKHDRFIRAARRHRISLKTPPKSVEEYLVSLEHCGLVETAERLGEDVAEL